MLGLLAIPAQQACAAFPNPVQDVQLRFTQKQATVVFEADSAIVRARSLCDCTTVSFSGNQLTAHIDVSGFTHDVRKEIEASTADGATTRLAMNIRVPQAVQLSARSLIWKLNSFPAPQSLSLRIPSGSPVKQVTKADLSGSAFTYDAVTLKPGTDYKVVISPIDTRKPILNRLIIRTDSKDPRFAAYIIYLSIQP